MARGKRPDTNTGNGLNGLNPILASGKGSGPTEEGSKLSQTYIETAQGSTKPVSLAEALSLLQTLCLDLRSLGCETAILAKDKRFYMILSVPHDTGKLSYSAGNIMIDNVPVSGL